MTQSEHGADASDSVIAFPAELTIAQTAEFYPQFAQRIDKGGDIILDGEAVTRIDTAFIQLLYQVQRTLGQSSHRLQWVNPSEAVARSVELLGMSEYLALTAAN